MDIGFVTISALCTGFILDAFFGDPCWLPHPIVFFGKIIAWFEKRLNNGSHRKMKGMALVLCLLLAIWLFFYSLQIVVINNTILLFVYISIFSFYGLANHTLIHEVLMVNFKLKNEGLDAGRNQLSRIVGRDTSQLSANQIRTASLETLSENLSDGVVAPLFYFAIGGIPAMFTYKMINTLDSMIAYKSIRYKQFGFFAAKIDDIANLIPARITALLIAIVSFSNRGIRYIFKYGNKHASPNSGYPEAALAGVLNCRFGGPNIYHGQLVDKPYIGENIREITDSDIRKSCYINSAVSITVLIMVCVIVYF